MPIHGGGPSVYGKFEVTMYQDNTWNTNDTWLIPEGEGLYCIVSDQVGGIIVQSLDSAGGGWADAVGLAGVPYENEDAVANIPTILPNIVWSDGVMFRCLGFNSVGATARFYTIKPVKSA